MKKIIVSLMLLFSINIYSENNNTVEVKHRKAFDVEGNKYIIRPFYGLSTTSDLGELITFKDFKRDPKETKIMGLQVERYVYKNVFDMPVNVTLQSSFIMHSNTYSPTPEGEKSGDNSYYTNKDSYEINFGLKIYWTKFPWDKYLRTRLGASEGISYISRVTNLERGNQYHKKNSNYLNYIDVTLSFNARDMTTLRELEDTYVGIGISHRSGIFGTINGVDGGGNNVIFFFETEL